MGMTKSNPLFVDSTKFHGDLIGTQIELRNVMIYDGEALFAVVVNQQGQPKRMPMKQMDERSFDVRLHLNHQTKISYRFEVERDGRIFLRSPDYTGRAQYAILEEWQPILDGVTPPPVVTMVQGANPAPPAAPPSPPKSPEAPTPPTWARDSAANVRSLLDKFEF